MCLSWESGLYRVLLNLVLSIFVKVPLCHTQLGAVLTSCLNKGVSRPSASTLLRVLLKGSYVQSEVAFFTASICLSLSVISLFISLSCLWWIPWLMSKHILPPTNGRIWKITQRLFYKPFCLLSISVYQVNEWTVIRWLSRMQEDLCLHINMIPK